MFFNSVKYIFVLLLAAFFSFLALGHARRFHPDEAYYMTTARHAAVNGDWWLRAEPVDKPPLTFYMNALALVFFAVESDANGVLQLDALKGEFAGRIPSMLLSIVLVAAVMKLATSLTKRDEAAYLAGILTALSPLRIVFAATAFTDMPMLCFGVLALLMAARGKTGWAGFWFMLSVAAKPQVMFYLPLLVFFVSYGRSILRPYKKNLMRFVWFIAALLSGAGVLWLWDVGRVAQGGESIWVLGQARYTPTSFTILQDYPARFVAFWETMQYAFGQGIITAVFLILGIMFSKRYILSLWLFVFFAIHMILTLNLFDRNLIVVLPVMAVVVGDAISKNREVFRILRVRYSTPLQGFAYHRLLLIRVGKYFEKRAQYTALLQSAVFAVLAICLMYSAFQAAWGKLPIGGDDGRHDGIHELADYMNNKPLATVIYDPWLDWELDYYMGQWTNKRRVFYPDIALLLRDALTLNEQGSRYFIVPVWIDESDWLSGLRENGFGVHLDRAFENFRVWELIPPSR